MLNPLTSSSCPFTAFVASVGTLLIGFVVVKTAYYFCKNVFVFFLAEPLGLTTKFKDLGEWAVITGATDGIGKAYAFALARRGCSVVLISRTLSKLQAVAKEIESAYPRINTKVIAADFTAGDEIYDSIRDGLKGLEIGVLINNVGMGALYPEEFHLMPGGDKACLDMIRCNIVAQTLMTKMVAPQMAKRKKGVILALSSGAGTMPCPYISVYSASKAYNDFFSRSLELEYRNQGIIVQSIMPYIVSTNMSLNMTANMLIVTAQSYARYSLNTVGYFSRSFGHPSHAVQSWFASWIPTIINDRLITIVMQKSRPAIIDRLKETGRFKEE